MSGNIGPSSYFCARLMSVFRSFLYASSFDVGVESESSRTHACMISSPASLHAFRRRTDHWTEHPESKSAKYTDRGRLESNH